MENNREKDCRIATGKGDYIVTDCTPKVNGGSQSYLLTLARTSGERAGEAAGEKITLEVRISGFSLYKDPDVGILALDNSHHQRSYEENMGRRMYLSIANSSRAENSRVRGIIPDIKEGLLEHFKMLDRTYNSGT